MKYACTLGIFCLLLFGTHIYAFKEGYAAGRNKVQAELYETTQKQAQMLNEANKKILDFQRIIGNNNDECFNRLWPDKIVESVNPSLLR